MSTLTWRRGACVLLVVAFSAFPAGEVAGQGEPAASGLHTLQAIPGPEPIVIPPFPFAAYGAMLAAAMLSALFLYRGRAFIIYWMASWILLAGTMALMSRSAGDARGGVLLGISALLSAWSAGLLLLAARAFPTNTLRWSMPLWLAVASAAWFMLSPLVLPPRIVLTSGPAVSAALLAWASLRYWQLARRTKYVGAMMMGAGIMLVALSDGVAAGLVAQFSGSGVAFSRLLLFNVVSYIFVALGMHLIVFEDITEELRRTNRELASANEEVRRLAITDPLTGCYNRHFFDEIERRETQRHRRYQSPLSVLFVDVDRFKHVNDELGHDTGDTILRAIGALLRTHVRESDYVIRWGGDEFLILLTCTAAQGEWKARELKAAFQTDPGTANLPGGVGLSIGVAQVAAAADNLTDTIRRADERMYHDKSTGRFYADNIRNRG